MGVAPGGLRTAAVCAGVLLALSGCTVVNGYQQAGAGRSSSESTGLAHPFLPLPAVRLAAVPDGYDPAADADATVAAALAASRADRRPVLLDFGSSWCGDCQSLSKLVDNPAVHQILTRDYHLVTVDVGHEDLNTALAARYVTLSRTGIPALVVLDPDGTARDTGDPGQFANARSLTADDFAEALVDWLYPPPKDPR